MASNGSPKMTWGMYIQVANLAVDDLLMNCSFSRCSKRSKRLQTEEMNWSWK